MVSHMVFLTKLGFENLKNLGTPSPFCKVGRVTEFGLKKPNHHLGPEYMCIFLGQTKYGIWGDFS